MFRRHILKLANVFNPLIYCHVHTMSAIDGQIYISKVHRLGLRWFGRQNWSRSRHAFCVKPTHITTYFAENVQYAKITPNREKNKVQQNSHDQMVVISSAKSRVQCKCTQCSPSFTINLMLQSFSVTSSCILMPFFLSFTFASASGEFRRAHKKLCKKPRKKGIFTVLLLNGVLFFGEQFSLHMQRTRESGVE